MAFALGLIIINSDKSLKTFKLQNLNFRSTCCTGSQETSMKNNCVNIPYTVYVCATTHLTTLHLPFKCTYVPLRWSLMSHSTPIEIFTNLLMEFLKFVQIFVKSLFRLLRYLLNSYQSTQDSEFLQYLFRNPTFIFSNP